MILAELSRQEASQLLDQGQRYLWLVVYFGLLGLAILTAMFIVRRWKRRQLKAIEQSKTERRTGQSAGRVDAWQASSDRYVDHDKLSSEDDDDLFARDDDASDPHDADGPTSEGDDDDERDPFGLFRDTPYQDPDDDDFDEGDDEDWDADDDDRA